jgi:hypothetical protein
MGFIMHYNIQYLKTIRSVITLIAISYLLITISGCGTTKLTSAKLETTEETNDVSTHFDQAFEFYAFENSIGLSWEICNTPTFNAYLIYKDGALVKEISESNTYWWIDQDILVGQHYDYEIKILDVSHNEIAYSGIIKAITNDWYFLLPNVLMWFDTSEIKGLSNNATVPTWNDLSGNNNDAYQPVTADRPLYVDNAILNKPIVRFTGSQILHLPWRYVYAPFSVIAVIRTPLTSSINTLIEGRSIQYGWFTEMPIFIAASPKYLGTSITYAGYWDAFNTNFDLLNLPNGGHIITTIVNVQDANFYVDGQHVGTTNGLQSFISSNLGNGNDGVFPFGDVAEIIILTTALNTTERTQLENSLKIKWGIQ